MRIVSRFLSLLLFLTAKASACGLVYSTESMARLVTEKTLIVWNDKEKTEDFIRSPQIETNNNDVGFIVPVPSVPEVTEVDDQIFSKLDQLIEERRPTQIRFFRESSRSKSKQLGGIDQSFNAAMPGTRGGVDVVKEFNLSKYEVKVLKAHDLEALKKWLKNNNYNYREAFDAWLKNYLDSEYFLTVFKFKKETASEGLKAQAISIKFKADAPFYPYRDSSDMLVSPDRNLKLYFLSDKAYMPDFNDLGEDKPKGFEETPEFSAQIYVKSEHKNLHFDHQSWLTVWTDTTKLRPDRDLIFKAESEQNDEILPDAKVIYLEDYFYLVLAGLFLLSTCAVIIWIIFKIYKKIRSL